MKTRVMLVVLLVICVSLSLAFAQSKNDCPAQTASVKSCCKNATQTDQASKASGTKSLPIVLASDKKSVAKSMEQCTDKNGKECTAAEKAQCDMAKAGKVSLTKASMKMDCCKDKAKTAKAEKKTQAEKSEAKGTN